MASAQKALTLALNAQFTRDGAHSEHSPAFHLGTLNALLGARAGGLIEGNAAALRLVELAEEAASAMLLPGGRLAAFGDTDFTVLPGHGKGDRFRQPDLIYTLSHGRSGTPPASGVRAFPDAGYAFARLHDGEPDKASYLAQMGSFNSRAHKHADHLSFIWAEGPMTILGDPGRYGYRGATEPGSDLHRKGFYYSDPKRIYVESTRAHNCVEIDGESHSRDLDHAYGSAFQQADIQDGLVVFDFEVNHPKAVRQIRTLILCPNQYLLVVDWLQSEAGRRHDFRQWFKLAPEWTDAAVEGVEVAAFCGLRTLCATDLLGSPASQIWRGAENPLRGWFSVKPGELQPAVSFNFSRLHTAEAAFATLFMLDGWIEPDAETKVESFAEAATFAFTAGERRVQIDYRREEGVTVKRTVR